MLHFIACNKLFAKMTYFYVSCSIVHTRYEFPDLIFEMGLCLLQKFHSSLSKKSMACIEGYAIELSEVFMWSARL